MKFRIALATALLPLFAPDVAFGKCITARIEVAGGDLDEPLLIEAPSAVGRFNIWNGPGARVDGQQIHLDASRQAGAFVDWPAGAVDRPAVAGTSYDVSFFCDIEEPSELRKMYEVTYHVDPGTGGGYIHFPGRDDERYGMNVSSIIHGIEGHWFRSSSTWERYIRPLIEQASTKEGRPPENSNVSERKHQNREK